MAWSEPEEIDGEVGVIWVSCEAGEGMRSGEYMVVKAKEDDWSDMYEWQSKEAVRDFIIFSALQVNL